MLGWGASGTAIADGADTTGSRAWRVCFGECRDWPPTASHAPRRRIRELGHRLRRPAHPQRKLPPPPALPPLLPLLLPRLHPPPVPLSLPPPPPPPPVLHRLLLLLPLRHRGRILHPAPLLELVGQLLVVRTPQTMVVQKTAPPQLAYHPPSQTHPPIYRSPSSLSLPAHHNRACALSPSLLSSPHRSL